MHHAWQLVHVLRLMDGQSDSTMRRWWRGAVAVLPCVQTSMCADCVISCLLFAWKESTNRLMHVVFMITRIVHCLVIWLSCSCGYHDGNRC
jgi:hypothetical protein